ncbi:hypothetical protein CVT26_014478 [Gymnopilus dilepis]|uniref:Uncharacterized protein n=1 Tax=Gymnopilus dilepis TaxID=231916 RepID=A0A409VVG2_9AGAR|nr:hypothetical protein CVT26_014478 [Gymnopilus dilepis]
MGSRLVKAPLPVADSCGDRKSKKDPDRQRIDNRWGGMRCFETGGGMGDSEWERGEDRDRMLRQRRFNERFTAMSGGVV